MFSKKDLDSGNVVEIRNGQKFLYHNIDRSKILDIRGYNYLELNRYDENFNRKAGKSEIFDIHTRWNGDSSNESATNKFDEIFIFIIKCTVKMLVCF